MKQRLKRLTALLLTALLLLGAAGCSSSGEESSRLMVWSASEDQSKDSGEWLQTCCERFAQLHPEWNITFVYGVADEATAANTVSQDPDASADVFLYANDNLTVLTDAKALAKLGGKYADEVSSFTSQALLDSVTLDGYLYGVPFTTNTWYMYYDKRVFSEKDVKSLDAMLEKGVVSFPFTNSWYLPTYTLNGETKQMYSYAGSKAVGVNSQSEHMAAAVELAVYLGSAEAQLLHYQLRSVIPSNTELMNDPEIAADPVVIAQNDTFDRTSVLQPFVSKMSNCWTPVENLGKAIRNGSATHANAAEQTQAMNDAMNSDGIS